MNGVEIHTGIGYARRRVSSAGSSSSSGGGAALRVRQLALQLNRHVHQGERGGSDAGNAAGLADGDGADALQRFAHLAREAADGAVLDPLGNGDGLGSLELFDGLLLLLEVAGELDLGFDGAGFVAERGACNGGSGLAG